MAADVCMVQHVREKDFTHLRVLRLQELQRGCAQKKRPAKHPCTPTVLRIYVAYFNVLSAERHPEGSSDDDFLGPLPFGEEKKSEGFANRQKIIWCGLR